MRVWWVPFPFFLPSIIRGRERGSRDGEWGVRKGNGGLESEQVDESPPLVAVFPFISRLEFSNGSSSSEGQEEENLFACCQLHAVTAKPWYPATSRGRGEFLSLKTRYSNYQLSFLVTSHVYYFYYHFGVYLLDSWYRKATHRGIMHTLLKLACSTYQKISSGYCIMTMSSCSNLEVFLDL